MGDICIVLTTKEVLNQYGISRDTLNKMIEEGLAFVAVGSRRQFDDNAVFSFIQARQQGVLSQIEVGKEYTNVEISAIFQANLQRGMKRSTTANALVLLSKHDVSNIYDDYWDENGVFYYTGMGFEGNQELNYENKTLYEANQNGVTLHLFEKFVGHEFIYRGVVKLAKTPFQVDEEDLNHVVRKVWKFPLVLIDEQGLLDKDVIDNQIRAKRKAIKKKRLSAGELKSKADVFNRNAHASARKVETTSYERNEYVRAYSLLRANGKCELCGQPAPFMVDGEPYLESHHIKWLSKGGSDSIDNVAGVCPNCHSRLHLLDEKADVDRLKKNVLIDEAALI